MSNLIYSTETTEEERQSYLTGGETITYNGTIIKPCPVMFVT
jgi:hypothetical protein